MEKNENFGFNDYLGRKGEISLKLAKIGKSLILEGTRTNEKNVASAGNLLIMISGLVLNEKDMSEFTHLTTMFTGKKILDILMDSPIGDDIRTQIDSQLFGEHFDIMKDIFGSDLEDDTEHTDDENCDENN